MLISHPFLDQFPSRRQSFVHGLFWYAHTADDWVHLPTYASTSDVNEMLKRVDGECDERIGIEWMSDEMKADCELIKGTLGTAEAKEFAKWVVEYEKSRSEGQQSVVKPKPVGATDPQRAFLKRLGYMKYADGNLTKWEASKLIEKLKG